MFEHVDLLVCGAGPVGCVIAERAACSLGWNVLIVDRRPHLAGNCHDSFNRDGLLVQNYGPHYFRTHRDELLTYLSRFTDWIPGNYVVKSMVRGELFDFPINLNTLEQFFGQSLSADSAELLLARQRELIDEPRNSEEFVLSRVGRPLYEAFYRGYTRKQWGLEPSELAAHVCGRIPVRLDRDNRYVDHPHQVMPAKGFTALFERMVKHPRINVLLGVSFQDVRRRIVPRRATVYSGPIDEYFDFCHGRLEYRSLKFEHRVYDRPLDQPFVQPCVQINYPNDFNHTRTVEFKHVTGQRHPRTVVSYETPTSTGEPFYPVPRPENQVMYRKYAERAKLETSRHRVYFCGRLATYRYLNTDEVILSALKCFEQLSRDAQVRTRPIAIAS